MRNTERVLSEQLASHWEIKENSVLCYAVTATCGHSKLHCLVLAHCMCCTDHMAQNISAILVVLL